MIRINFIREINCFLIKVWDISFILLFSNFPLKIKKKKLGHGDTQRGKRVTRRKNKKIERECIKYTYTEGAIIKNRI